MVSITSLWLAILLSAVFVFIISSVIHMVFKYHQNDFTSVPDEEGVRGALGKFDIPPGDYVIPRADSMEVMRSDEYKAKLEEGPVTFLTVLPKGQSNMTTSLIQWFVYSIVVGIFAAYISSRALSADAHYLEVFRFAGCTAFIGYTLALWQNAIWYKRGLTSILKSTFDGLIYALITAGTFGWLWPNL